MSSLGKPVPHESAREHVTGEAVYIDDLPPLHGELLVGFVGSPHAHARILSVDVTAARAVEGVAGVWTHADVPGSNHFGPAVHDEELLAAAETVYVGQPVVLIAAETPASLAAARRKVRIVYEPLPAVLTIDEAVAAGRFIGLPRTFRRGDAEAALAAAEHVLEGVFVTGGQEHFYLESQAALAVPGEAGQVTVHSSTQNPAEVQALVAECLGLGRHQVICVCKRMGGGFGGKETQAAQPAIFAAMAARLTRRPARCALDKDTDMAVTGKRHPFQTHWRVGFRSDGTITALKAHLYSNGGFSQDLSPAVLERAMFHADNAYFIADMEVTGTICRTHLPSNTAFRGFGGPQGVAVAENYIEEVAGFLGMDPFEVRRRNVYGTADRNVTHYGQVITHNTLPAILDRLAETSRYRARRAEIAAFNARRRGTLRGIALTPEKIATSFTRTPLTPGNAFLNQHPHGTVQVSHGGTEMGQGLNTKIRQIVADQFGIGLEAVIVLPTGTDRNNNTSPTAASASTDLNGTAAARACAILKDRIADFAARRFGCDPGDVRFADGKVFAEADPAGGMTFADCLKAAYEVRVDLGARGFYATPGIGFDRTTNKGSPFLYFTNGAAVCEVEVDRFTGDVKLTAADILMDIGVSMNPAIDRGQIIGGFVQGLGWATAEELRYGPGGELLSHSPTTYKIPGINDVPERLRLDLFENRDNKVNIHSSKAVGEPPLLLGLSAWAAVRAALTSVAGGRRVRLDLPATHEEVLMRLAELERPAVPAREPAAVG